MLDHARLDEQRRLRRINASGEPVDHHVARILLDHMRRVVMRRQRVPVGHKKQALVLVLQTQPVFQHPMIVAKMQASGGAHAGKNAIGIHLSGVKVGNQDTASWIRSISCADSSPVTSASSPMNRLTNGHKIKPRSVVPAIGMTIRPIRMNRPYGSSLES